MREGRTGGLRDKVVAVKLVVNGRAFTLAVEPRTTLLDALRDELALTGTKKACDRGECGACTVHVEGRRVLSCMTLAAMQDGKRITTIEGLEHDHWQRGMDMATRQPISREDLDAGLVDFSDVDSIKRLPPVHRGDLPRHDFLKPSSLSAGALALRVACNRITAILAGKRPVTAETVLRLSRHFGTSAGFWLNLQQAYELEVMKRANGARIRAKVTPPSRPDLAAGLFNVGAVRSVDGAPQWGEDHSSVVAGLVAGTV